MKNNTVGEEIRRRIQVDKVAVVKLNKIFK